jgi:hypothetical protein
MSLPNSANVLDFISQATKEQGKLRMAISGPSGSGKTFTAINVLMHMGCEKILVLDTEHGSAAKYSNEFLRKFDVIDNRYWQSNFDPRRLIATLKAVAEKYDGVVCDSLTHFWMGPGGMLSLVDAAAKKGQARNGKYDSFAAWKEVDPVYNELVQTILGLPCHFAACLRAKSEYEDKLENGKNKKVKVGMASQMREGFEYEFDVEGMMTMSHEFIVGKTRCRALDELVIPKPGANMAGPLKAWLTEGAPMAEKPAQMPMASAFLAPPVVTVEPENAPPTERNLVAAEVTPVAVFVAKIDAAATAGDLKSVAGEIKVALTDKVITQADYNAVLSPAYAAKNKAIKAMAA